MFKFFSLTAFALSVAIQARANCELSWVSDVEKTQNWIHTVATYPETHRHVYLSPSVKASSIDLKCEPASCDALKTLSVATKSCALGKSKFISPPKTGDAEVESEPPQTITRYGACTTIPKENAIAYVDKTVLKFPNVYPLARGIQTADASLDKTLHALPELKSVQFSQFPELKMDVSRASFKSFTVYTNPKLPESAVAEAKLTLKLNQFTNVCKSEPCANANKEIEYPLLFLKHGGKWRLFGNGTIGDCSAYKGDGTEPTLEQKLLQPFGLPAGYTFYDEDGDGKADLLQLSPRPHLPGTIMIYSLAPSSVDVETELCAESVGTCNPEPGC